MISKLQASPSHPVPPWQLIWCKSPGDLGLLPEPSTDKGDDQRYGCFVVVIINICRYSRIPPPGTFEALTLAATMLIPIPLLRGLFSVTGTTSGSACSTYLKQTIIHHRCSHVSLKSLIIHWCMGIVCSGLTVHGADVDLGKCTVQIPFEFVWTVREQRPEERNSCSWICKIQFLFCLKSRPLWKEFSLQFPGPIFNQPAI